MRYSSEPNDNNMVKLNGTVEGLTTSRGSDAAYCNLKVGNHLFQCLFSNVLYVPTMLEGRKIRVLGMLDSGYYGDVVVKVKTYELTTRNGQALVQRPDNWRGRWPLN